MSDPRDVVPLNEPEDASTVVLEPVDHAELVEPADHTETDS
jgi:hypothetical protein